MSYKFALLFGVLLSLGLVSTTFAADNIVNGSFDEGYALNSRCSLNGWLTTGGVSVVNGTAEGLVGADACVAKIQRTSDGLSQLEQTFQPNSDNYILRLNFWANYNMGTRPMAPDQYLTQTISLYDADNNVIYSASRNYNYNNGRSYFKYDLSDYIGRDVRLEVKVVLDSRSGTSPISSTLYIDKVQLYSMRTYPGDGTYSW
jgi:hypothetical protein